MTRGRYYSSVVPIAGVLYVIVLFATGFNATVVTICALVLVLIVVVGPALFSAHGGGRNHNRNRIRG